jgi:hypothetical protein
LGIQLGEESVSPIVKEVYEWLEENGTPPGITVEGDDENDTFSIIVAADADKKEIKEWVKDAKPSSAIKAAINAVLKGAKSSLSLWVVGTF